MGLSNILSRQGILGKLANPIGALTGFDPLGDMIFGPSERAAAKKEAAKDAAKAKGIKDTATSKSDASARRVDQQRKGSQQHLLSSTTAGLNIG